MYNITVIPTMFNPLLKLNIAKCVYTQKFADIFWFVSAGCMQKTASTVIQKKAS